MYIIFCICNWESISSVIQIVTAVAMLVIAWVALNQETQIKSLSQLIESSYFMRPAMLQVVSQKWINTDRVELEIIIKNIGKPLFLIDQEWIQENVGSTQHNSFDMLNKINTRTLFMDINHSGNQSNVMIFPALVNTNERLMLLTTYKAGSETGTGANMDLTIEFIDVDGLKFKQSLVGHPYGVIHTGYRAKSWQ